MGASVFVIYGLPVALAIIMLGLGLSLTVADFKRVGEIPRTVLIALGCQVILLPLVCLGVAEVFNLSPVLAVGLMLLAASPGGTSANLFSHLAGGDVALNISLTAINSVLAIITLPIVVNLSFMHFFGDGTTLPLQFGKVLQVFSIVLVPVVVGMLLRSRFPAFASAAAPYVKNASVIFLLTAIVMSLASDWNNFVEFAPQVGGAALVFNLLSLAVGYFVPLMLKVSQRQATAIGMEIGIHNAVLAITIAMSPLLLNNATMAMPAAIYGLLANFTATGFGFWVSRRHHGARPVEYKAADC